MVEFDVPGDGRSEPARRPASRGAPAAGLARGRDHPRRQGRDSARRRVDPAGRPDRRDRHRRRRRRRGAELIAPGTGKVVDDVVDLRRRARRHRRRAAAARAGDRRAADRSLAGARARRCRGAARALASSTRPGSIRTSSNASGSPTRRWPCSRMRDDLKNLFAATLAKVHGARFTVAIVHEAASVGVFEHAGVDVTVNPRQIDRRGDRALRPRPAHAADRDARGRPLRGARHHDPAGERATSGCSFQRDADTRRGDRRDRARRHARSSRAATTCCEPATA